MGIACFPDHEPVGRCASCGNYDALDNLVMFEGERYHEDSEKCRTGIVRCSWCGEGVEKEKAIQIGDWWYHRECWNDMPW